MRALLLSLIVGVATLGFAATPQVHAQYLGYQPYYNPAFSAYYGGYYGTGFADTIPHWHQTVTPYGAYNWYGLAPHDYTPHLHTYGLYGNQQSYSFTPYGYTRSFNINPYSYYYGAYWPSPYGGYGGLGYYGYPSW